MLNRGKTIEFMSGHDEFIHMYEKIFPSLGYQYQKFKTKTIRIQTGKFIIPAHSKYRSFYILTNNGKNHLNCHIIISIHNQVYITYLNEDHTKRGIKRIYSASSVKRSIEILKETGTFITI